MRRIKWLILGSGEGMSVVGVGWSGGIQKTNFDVGQGGNSETENS